MSKEIEDKLNQRWGFAKAMYEGYQAANTTGLTPIELARLNMNAEKARTEYLEADAAIKEYVNKNIKLD